MSGFFTAQQTESKSRPLGRTYSCAQCGLAKSATNPKMEPFGNFKMGILNIGEAPGEVEDERGKQWQGKTGKLLQRAYKKLGIDLFEDCLNVNAVNCRPTKNESNRTPTAIEIANCRYVMVDNVIKEYQPSLIMVFGGCALTSIIGHRFKQNLGGIMKWRGWTIPDQDLKCWVCPTFHPSFVERSEDSVVELIWMQDIRNALDKLKEKFPRVGKPQIDIIEDLSVLNKVNNLFAIDFETTGLKPQSTGHRIISCAISDNVNHAYAFLMPKTRKQRQPLLDLLESDLYAKIAHNLKFEEMWSTLRLKQPVKNWFWDTMLASHILDNRTGVTGLKFQVYANFGVIDYASDVEQFIDTKKNSNALNSIDKLLNAPNGKETLLKYNGLDAIYTYRLATKQLEAIEHSYLPF